MRTAFVTIFILTFLLGSCSQPKDSPESVALQYVSARYDYDWAQVSNLLDQSSMAQFKTNIIALNNFLDSVDLQTEGKVTSDSMLNFLRNERMQSLSSAEFFRALMQTSLPMETMQQSSSHLTPTITSLGHVTEGGDTAYVIQRFYALHGKDTINTVQLISLRRFSGNWKVILPEELRGYMKMRLNTQRAW
jgi:hypothetical protein